MTHPIFSRIPILGKTIDERCLEHRRRSTSLAGILGCLVAGGLFEYRLIHDHILSWDLFVVILTMAAVKVTMMLWYRFND
jgi:hypothetical protein